MYINQCHEVIIRLCIKHIEVENLELKFLENGKKIAAGG